MMTKMLIYFFKENGRQKKILEKVLREQENKEFCLEDKDGDKVVFGDIRFGMNVNIHLKWKLKLEYHLELKMEML